MTEDFRAKKKPRARVPGTDDCPCCPQAFFQPVRAYAGELPWRSKREPALASDPEPRVAGACPRSAGKRSLTPAREIPLEQVRGAFSRMQSEILENGRSVRAVASLCIINTLERRAGVVQWQYRSFPSFGHGFDSRRPLQLNQGPTRIHR
jgi:hypothetical protein